MTKPRFDKNWDDLAHKIGYSDKREMLTDMYITKRLSLSQIGERLQCGTYTVNRHLELLNITRRKRGGFQFGYAQSSKLFHLDQRVVHYKRLTTLSELVGISESLIYKYRRFITRQEEE